MAGIRRWALTCLLGVMSAAPAVAGAATAAGAVAAEATAGAAQLPAQARKTFIDGLMARMTLDEKIGQLRLISITWGGGDFPREKVLREAGQGRVGGIFNTVVRPDIRGLQDAALASRLKIPLFFAYDVAHGHRTVFPISLGLASSWDLDAVERSARVAAREASADGLDMTFAPMVDVSRDPRWGRVSEGFGEDTYLTAQMGAAMVRGFQGQGRDGSGNITATVKHYALYGAVEGGREYNTVDMSPQRMFQDYLPPYKAGVDAGAGAVMVSLSTVNGVPATANRWLLEDVLRRQWGFEGLVISDHGAIGELVRHGVASDARDAARVAIQSGVDMSMNDAIFGAELAGLVHDGLVPMARVDAAVRRVLEAKYDMGLFGDPYLRVGQARDDPADTDAESRLHRKAAREVARDSLVLLKNAGATLPLARRGTIAVVGPLARSQRDVMGSWSAAGKARQAVTVYDGLVAAAGGQARILYAKGANVTDDPEEQAFLNLYAEDVEITRASPQAMIQDALDAAGQADVVVAVVGEAQGMAHEASSRTDIRIPESQRRLLRALKASGKPLVVVLMNGRPLTLEWEAEHADALLEAWFPGTEGGNAIADVLFGDHNPSGKLPMSFPRAVGQIPVYYSQLNTGRPFDPDHPDKYTSRYYDVDFGPLFPFGYGLSYTRFALTDFTLSQPTMRGDETLTAGVTVSNQGARAGATVVQLYLRDVTASVSQPVQLLRGFRKVMLQPGESRRVEFPIRRDDLAFYDAGVQRVVEPGEFRVQVGLDAREVQTRSFRLE
ncbi:beta-glucosidase BglX [Bordetella sp. 2513F-2]